MTDTLAQKLALHLTLGGGATAETTPPCRLVNHNVEIGERYASYNGTDAYLEVNTNTQLKLGNEDFSRIAVS